MSIYDIFSNADNFIYIKQSTLNFLPSFKSGTSQGFYNILDGD